METGDAVAFVGDFDGDGRDDAVVGSPGSDKNGEDSGAVALILGPLMGIVDAGHCHGNYAGRLEGDDAGRTVTGLADMDGDGHDDFAIGAPLDPSGAEKGGAVYVFRGRSL